MGGKEEGKEEGIVEGKGVKKCQKGRMSFSILM